MKILIEESVLRQALDALIDFNQQSIGGIALPAEIDTAMDALSIALEAESGRTLSDKEIELIWDMTEFHGGDDWNAALEFARAVLKEAR